MKWIVGMIVVIYLIAATVSSQKKPPAAPQPLKAWKLAFVRDGNIWVANGDGTEHKLIIKNGESPCWSPDRKQIAFARDGNVWVANADGSGQKQLTFRWRKREPERWTEGKFGAGRDIDICWDPKANLITFSHWEEWLARRAGSKDEHGIIGHSIFDVPWRPSKERGLTTRFDLYDDDTFFHFSHHCHPAWSRSGKRMAFVRNGDIWIADRDPQLNERVGRGKRYWEWDVTRLAAVAEYDAPTDRGSRVNRGVTHLSWSPDEKFIAYSIRRLRGSGSWEIHLMRVGVDEYDRPQVKEDRRISEDGVDPCFSPDGQFIVYHGEMPGGSLYDIIVISIDGKLKKRLIEDGKQPAW